MAALAILDHYTGTVTSIPRPTRTLTVAELRQRQIDRRLAPYTLGYGRAA